MKELLLFIIVLVAGGLFLTIGLQYSHLVILSFVGTGIIMVDFFIVIPLIARKEKQLADIKAKDIESNLPDPQKYIESILPVCTKCGHSACPHCKDWCDVIATSKEQIREFGVNALHVKDLNNEKNYPILCCNGDCNYKQETIIRIGEL